MSTIFGSLRPKAGTTGSVELNLNPRAMVRFAAVMSAFIVGVSVASGIVLVLANDPSFPVVGAIFDAFDLDREAGIAAWWSSGLLLVLALTFVALGAVRRAPAPFGAAAVVAGLMSMDEIAGFHERLSPLVSDLLDAKSLRMFGWLLPGAVIASLLLYAVFRFTSALGGRATSRFRTGAILFIAGAVVLEAVGAFLHSKYGDDGVPYRISIIGEESLEMFGTIFMLWGGWEALAFPSSSPESSERRNA